MTKIKLFTDLQQSKKLAEILPLESADMYYNFDVDFTTGEFYFPADGSSIMVRRNNKPLNLNLVIPCWSLAVLVSVLPEIQGGKPVIALDDNYVTYPHISDLHTKAGNLVDACVAMIERLHGLKML